MTNTATSSTGPGTDNGAAAPETVLLHNEATQLSNLSSVLNGLESGASLIRRHVQDAMRAVRSGTYRVDAAQLSRRIVREAMGTV